MMMSNIIETIDNPDGESCDSFLQRNDETSGCRLVETLEKNLAILRLEARQVGKINSDLRAKLVNFNELTSSMTKKLQTLMILSDLRFGDKDSIKEFVEQITLSWLRTNKQMIKEHSGIRVASRTATGTPLAELLETKKKEAAAIKISLQIGSVIYDQDYVSRGYKIHEQISRLLDSLERCDDKAQQYMIMCTSMPYLVDLSAAIDDYVAKTDLLPSSSLQSANPPEDLGAFRLVSKLLTGELLGHRATNPRQILAENAPRKPVFITLNTKRKIEMSNISRSKIPRSASFPSALKSDYTQL